jgi:hypothetical protein
MSERRNLTGWFLLGVLALVLASEWFEDHRDRQDRDAALADRQAAIAELRRMHAEAGAAFATAEQTGESADLEAAQRKSDQVEGALRVLEAEQQAR